MLKCSVRKTLRDFDLDMDFTVGNETLVIVGHSGCGKSTTLKLLAGLTAPDEGRITVGERVFYDGERKRNVTPEARSLGFVFQNYALFPHLSVFENVAYGLDGKKLSKADKTTRVKDMLQMLNIPHLVDSMPADLSGGEQQRVALARALVLQPGVLLLDEPLSALDVTTRGRVRRELKKTLASLEIPTIIVTHDYEDAISLGDRILVMDRGHIIQEGTARELLTRPRSPFVADFSGTNFFSGEVLGSENGMSRVRLNESGKVFWSAQSAVEGSLSVMIYPWDIRLATAKPADGSRNVIEGEAVNILSYGNRARVEMEGEVPLITETSESMIEELGLKEQDTVYAIVDPHFVQVLKNTQEVV
ncbi:MAG TPA: ABC transporter ATP-binding protein [Bacillales bacterium]|nr:ABC transporter ATP-binding protein [Bacillales bacterium]